jgi:predicted RNA-binding protein YlxR (DUF448 family)
MDKKIPLRKCVGCGEMKNKKEMIRIVRSPEGDFSVDATGKKNGRGAYLCNNEDCLEKAVKGHGLEKSFSTAISKEVYDALKTEFKNIEK